jgi:predicted nucleotidyltransferase component of viral defense system
LDQVKEETRAQDLSFLERCVLALELVGRLRQHGLQFVFKGGTCILLHLPSPQRLSIDVDIICQEPRERIEAILRQVVQDPPFTAWNYQQHRERDEPPTRHFEVFFDSTVNPSIPGRILIDVIEGEVPHAKVEAKPLVTAFVEPEESILIPVPTISSLLWDKLAAFAPETIGYPYEPLNRRASRTSRDRQMW